MKNIVSVCIRFLMLASLCLLVGCAHTNSYYTKNEEVILKLKEPPLPPGGVEEHSLAVDAATQAVGFAYDLIVDNLIKPEGKKYKGVYSISLSETDFYASNMAPPEGFTLTRRASRKEGTNIVEAMTLDVDFRFDPSNDFFRIIPREFTLKKSKAKILDTWLDPLVELFTDSYTKELDLLFNIKLTHSYRKDDFKLVVEEGLGDFDFALKDVEPRETKYTFDEKAHSTWLAAPFKGNRGVYTLAVTVTEVGDLAEVIEKLAEKADEKKDDHVADVLSVFGLEVDDSDEHSDGEEAEEGEDGNDDEPISESDEGEQGEKGSLGDDNP